MRGVQTAEQRERVSTGEPPPAKRRGHKRLIAVLVAVTVIVVLAGVGIAWWNQRGPSRPSIGQAVDRFRSSSGVASGSAAMQPTPGVYIYSGQGEESLSFLATHQSQDGSLPGTVTNDGHGCWSFAIEYNSFHRESWRRCQVDGRLVDHGNTTDQKFDFGALSQSEHTEVVCNPAFTLFDPAFKPGHRETVRCVGTSATTKAHMTQRGHMTFVGPTTVVVGKRRVRALHYAEDVTISRDQSGSSHEELWIAATDGLPLREERTISVVSPAPAPLNHVTYSERGTWTLTSLTPHS